MPPVSRKEVSFLRLHTGGFVLAAIVFYQSMLSGITCSVAEEEY